MNFSISVGFLELLLLILLWFTENISENYFDIPENLWKRERGREKPHNMQMRGWENWPMWSGSPWGQRVIQGVNVPNLNRFLTIDTWRRIWRGCFFILDWFFPLSLSLSLSRKMKFWPFFTSFRVIGMSSTGNMNGKWCGWFVFWLDSPGVSDHALMWRFIDDSILEGSVENPRRINDHRLGEKRAEKEILETSWYWIEMNGAVFQLIWECHGRKLETSLAV